MSEAKMLFWLIVILAGACGIGWLALRLIRKYKTGENWALGVLILTACGFLIYVLMASMGIENLLLCTIPPSASVFGCAIILLSRQHWSNVPRTNNDAVTNKYTKQIWFNDDKGNCSSVEYWGSERRASKALDSLTDCYGCTNCDNCSGCGNCIGCHNCTNCHACFECYHCSDCTDGRGWVNNATRGQL